MKKYRIGKKGELIFIGYTTEGEVKETKGGLIEIHDRGEVIAIESLDKLNAEVLAGLTGKERENFEKGLRKLDMANPANRDALRVAFKRLKPDATERELDIMVSGKAPQDNKQEWGL